MNVSQRKINKKKIEVLDSLFTNKFIGNLINYLMIILFCVFMSLAFVGIRQKLYDGYFEVLVMSFIFFICFLGWFKHFSKMDGALYYISPAFILIGFLNVATGDKGCLIYVGNILFTLILTMNLIYSIIRSSLIKKYKIDDGKK